MTETPKKKSLRDYILGSRNKLKKKFRVSYVYMDLQTHQDVSAVDKSSALAQAKKELHDPSHMRNISVKQINEGDQHWDAKSREIIDAVVKQLGFAHTAQERRDILQKMAEDHKVNYSDLYNAIVSKTGTQFFSNDN